MLKPITTLATLLIAGAALAAEPPKELRLDYAYYNPTSLVLKEKRFLEDTLESKGTKVRWVLSLGSNKALEFLNAGSIDLGSTAGAAALLGRINGNPIKSVYAYSKPEWTALVTNRDSPIRTIADLKGKRVAVTRGTDPHIFLVRSLARAGLTEKDVRLVLLQHQDGRTALEQKQVDAWAGLDPLMAQAEIESGARLFYRDAESNTWGVLNVREEFADRHPDIVGVVLSAYERARLWALANPAEFKSLLASASKLSDAVAARQLERTDLSTPIIGGRQRETILAAGLALQEAGVIPATVQVEAAVDSLLDTRFGKTLASR